MKTSLFNIILDDGGDLMLFNSMRGLNSLCKVSENCREKVLEVLNRTVEDKEIEDILIDCGYLVDDNCDEKMKQELLYSYINSGNILRLIILPTEQCNFR